MIKKNHREKIYIICPRTKQFCGVFDHSKKIKRILDGFFNVKILSNQNDFDSGPEDKLIAGWNLRGYLLLLNLLLKERPVVNIQYVGWMYQRSGIPLSLVIFVILLKILRLKVITTFHETYVPGLNWRWKILRFFQRIIFIFLLLASDYSLFSVKKWKDHYRPKTMLIKNKVEYIPIGTNFKVKFVSTKDLRSSLGFEKSDKVVATFNPSGSGKNLNYLLETYNLITNKNKKLLIIGGKIVPRDDEGIIQFVDPDEEMVKKLLSISDVYLSTFADGVSSRRSSCLSAISMGIPTVTNFGKNTDNIFRDSPILFSNDSTGASRQIDDLFKKKRVQLRRETAAFYKKHFNDELITRLYIKIIHGLIK